QTRTGKIRVLGDGITADMPALTSLIPPTAKIFSFGASANLTIGLDLPAPATGILVTLAATNGWTVAPTVSVAQDQLTATFPVTQAGTMTTSAATASYNGVDKMSTLSIDQHPVINEVNYVDPTP